MSEPRRLLDVSAGLWVNDRLLEHRLPGCQVGTVVPTTDHDVTYGVWFGFGSWEDRGDEDALLPGWGRRANLLFEAPKAPLTTWPAMGGDLGSVRQSHLAKGTFGVRRDRDRLGHHPCCGVVRGDGGDPG